MKIKREVNGVPMEFTLSKEEMLQTYEYVYYRNEKWFGEVRWCDEDLKNALEEEGVPTTEENVAELRSLCMRNSFTDTMIAAGWDTIYELIYERFKKEA